VGCRSARDDYRDSVVPRLNVGRMH
jgi:hypothetical protein